ILVCKLLLLERSPAVGRERSEQPTANEHGRPRRAAEHDARHRRRQANVHYELTLEHAGSRGNILGAVGAHRPRRNKDGSVLPRRFEFVSDWARSRARYAALLSAARGG